MGSRLLTACVILSLLLGCAPAQLASPTPEPIPQVTVGPTALPLSIQLGLRYRDQFGALPFDLVPASSETGLDAAARGEALFHLDFGPVPEGWFATPVAWEGIAVVVDSGLPTRSLSLADLRELFSGRQTRWEAEGGGGPPVQLVAPIPDDRLFQHFLGLVGQEQPLPPTAIIGPVPEAMISYVGDEPGAVGLIPFSHGIPSGLRALRIEGSLPGPSTIADGRYPLRVQLLAMAPVEPDPAAIEWLLWAQGTPITPTAEPESAD